MTRCEDCPHPAHWATCQAEVERTGSTYWGDLEETRVNTCRCRNACPDCAAAASCGDHFNSCVCPCHGSPAAPGEPGGPYLVLDHPEFGWSVGRGESDIYFPCAHETEADDWCDRLNAAHAAGRAAGLREAVEWLRERARASDQYLDYGPDSNALMSAASALAARLEAPDAK